MEDIKKELNRTNTDLFSYMNENPYNYSAILSGTPGSGVGFLTKYEIIKTYLNTEDDVIVFDTNNEFGHLTKSFGGVNIDLGYPSNVHINPLDAVKDTDIKEQFDRKTILFKAFYEIITNSTCTETQEYSIKKALATVYKENENPKLIDLYNVLEKDLAMKTFADALLVYSAGNAELLSRETNIEFDRLTIFNLRNIRKTERSLFTLAMLDSLFERINKNLKNGKRTWIFLDDFSNLLANKNINPYIANTFKAARLMGVKIIGITRNLIDILTDESIRPILMNTFSLELLNQNSIDRNILRNLFGLSGSNLECITMAEPGNGLLCVGPKRIPFKCSINRDDKFYKKAVSAFSEDEE